MVTETNYLIDSVWSSKTRSEMETKSVNFELKRMNHSLLSLRHKTIKYIKYIIKPNNVGEIVLKPTVLL